MEEETENKETVDLCMDLPFDGGLRKDDEEKEKRREDGEEKETKAPNDPSGEPPVPLVLEPNHPMMERFQIALKNHLLKQIDKLSNQVSDLVFFIDDTLRLECGQDNEIKEKEKEREKTGVELYAMQQEIYKQQKALEDCDSATESLMKERQELDESVRSKKTTWKEEVNRLNCAKKKESTMMAEFQKLSFLEKQMEKWEKEMESELTISQRISEKTHYDKNKLIEEKRKMDMYLLRLMTAVSNYESEMKLLDGEIDMKMEEKDMLNQTLADAAADLQCLITEQKRLFSAWNSVVSTVNQRNLIYVSISKELAKCQEAFRSLNTEIESYKRSSAEEMKKSERLAGIYGRLQNESENTETTLSSLMEKKVILDDKITSTAAIINRSEFECQAIKQAKENFEISLIALRNNIEKLNQEKRLVEDETMNFIHDQIFNNKSASHLNKLIKDTREKTRKQEFILLENENKISQKFLEIEELKEIITRNNEIIEEMTNEVNAKEEELKKINDEISKYQSAIISKQGNYATLLRKIEKFMEKTGFGKVGMSPLQHRVVELERANADMQAKNDKLQSFWLLEQNNNVKLTQQRNEQLKDISLLRRQVLILEQRALKIDTEFERERKIENDVNKSILQLQHKLTVLNEIFVNKKDYKENLGRENLLTQTQFVQNLKDAELEQIQLKAEIKELEANLEELAETMLSVQREMLAWEKKIQSAIEAKNDMQKERSGSGEIGQMKLEIHRMEIRFGHLKRIQDKLITDLEQCVLRRDAILDGADAMEKRQAKGYNSRFVIQKKLETIRNNIRQTCSEQKHIEQLIANTEEGHSELKKAILEKEAQLMQMEETTKKMDYQLDEGKLRKIQNLEMLIRRQKKCKMYELVKSGKHRLLFKNESITERELQKVKCANANLLSVVEALMADFPAYRFPLKKICNTLQAKPS